MSCSQVKNRTPVKHADCAYGSSRRFTERRERHSEGSVTQSEISADQDEVSLAAHMPNMMTKAYGEGTQNGRVSPSDLWYWLRLLRPGAVAARRNVVGALHARQAPNDRNAAPGNGIGRDNRLRQGDPPLIAPRVRAGHQLPDLAAYTLQVGSAIWISRHR